MSARLDAVGDYLYGTSAPAVTAITITTRLQIVVDRDAIGTVISTTTADGTAWAGVYLATNGTQLELKTSTGVSALGTTLTVGQWYHIAYVRNGSTHTMYLDGAQDAQITANVAIASPVHLLGGDAVVVTNGRFQDNGVWSAVLSQADIAAERNSVGAAARTANLWAYRPLTSDGNDTTGNARNFIANGVAWEANLRVGNAALTQAGNTVTAAGKVAIAGALSKTQAGKSCYCRRAEQNPGGGQSCYCRRAEQNPGGGYGGIGGNHRRGLANPGRPNRNGKRRGGGERRGSFDSGGAD
jgi:hypothetical protein